MDMTCYVQKKGKDVTINRRKIDRQTFQKQKFSLTDILLSAFFFSETFLN